MLTRITRGELPPKPHTVLRGAGNQLRYEHCLTRDGFDGPYTISYHLHRPQAIRSLGGTPVPRFVRPEGVREPLRRRHFPCPTEPPSGTPGEARVALLGNDDLTLCRCTPTSSDSVYTSYADHDVLLYIQSGRGRLVSSFGSLPFEEECYLFVPRGVVHRFELETEARASSEEGTPNQHWLVMELVGALALPAGSRNAAGQLRMDAPYSFRDFRLPEFLGPIEEGIRRVAVHRHDVTTLFQYAHSPLDMVGFDGSIYPWCFPIRRFQPRVASVHLPPTVHGSFEARGVLICSFVPRPLDFGRDAIPCPYPHSSVDIDEVLFYSAGDFASRTGVGPGSITFHPRGVPHGPQPGRYEESLGKTHTDELAVMLDCQQPLCPTELALTRQDPNYEQSFLDTAD